MSEKTRCVSVGEISYERSERIDSPSTSEIKRFVGLEHFDQGNLEIVRFGSCVDLGSTMKKCVSGDTLIARRNVYLKRASRCNYDALCSGDAIVLRENECVVPGFLSILFNSDSFWKFASSNADGTMSKRLSVSHLKSYEFRLPSVENQKKFVDLIWKLENLKTKLVMELENLNLLIKSRFIEMFGTSANPKYGQVRIADLVLKDIEKVPKKYGLEDIIDYIDISSIDKESRSIVETTEYAVKDAPSRAQQCVIEGDILLSNVRPNLKTLAIVNSSSNNLVCSTGFTVLRCKDSCPEYLTIAITDDYFTNILVKKANGSNYPAVTSKDVYNSIIPSAPIELQKQFATFVQQVDKSKFESQQHIDNTKKLQKTIINSIFQEP